MQAGLVSIFSPWPVYYEAGGSAVPDIGSQAQALEQLQAIWPVAVPFLASVGFVLAPIVNYFLKRKDKATDTTMTREQRLMAETDARIAQASKIDGDVMARLQAEIVRVTDRMADLERDRDKAATEKDAAWDRAHYWHRRAHDMRHIATIMTTLVTDAARAAGREMPATPDLSLPAFNIDPLPT